MDVSTDLVVMTLLFNQMGLEAALEQATHPSVTGVEIARVAAVEVLHTLGKVGLRRLHKKMLWFVLHVLTIWRRPAPRPIHPRLFKD